MRLFLRVLSWLFPRPCRAFQHAGTGALRIDPERNSPRRLYHRNVTSPANDADRVRSAFAEQAHWCRQLGSPFTALLCEALAAGLDADTEGGRVILDWRGNPFAQADALPLRVAGALHALVRA